MRKIMIAVAALLVVSPAVANHTSSIEKIVYYYEDSSYRDLLGETVYYCDGTDVTYGFVSSVTQETLYTCP
jgi:hypothetical protein